MKWDYAIYIRYPYGPDYVGGGGDLVALPDPIDVKVSHKFTINSAQGVDGALKSKIKFMRYHVQLTWVVEDAYLPSAVASLIWNMSLWPDGAAPVSFDGGSTWFRMTLDGDPTFTPVNGKYVGFELVVKLQGADPITRDNYYEPWHLGIPNP